MSYPYQITSPEAYTLAYEKSTQAPEAFWAEIASSFLWKNPGTKCWIGILQSLKWNGLKVQNSILQRIASTGIWGNWKINLPLFGNQMTPKNNIGY
jgi:hypothetical protein